MTNPIDLEIDPGRLCFGLSRIGYTPASAICDIIDNSISADAKNVHILIHKDREDLSDTRKNNVQDYVIIDDGHGMNYEQMKEALKLGSSSQNYEEHSLSKFGLGLKSAAFSQGDELHLISSAGSSFKKYVVSLPQIQSQEKYFATDVELNDVDAKLISRYLPDSKGTIIRISSVRKINHPSVKKTLDELKYKIGVIYYYFIIDGIKISLENEVIQDFDVLFSSEADQNGNLDEHTWDAKTVKWIERKREVVLDADNDVRATIEVTQLPYPPIFNLEQQGKGADIREKYRIGAGNYGYYVYRNKRLISWAEGFEGIIPQSIDYYAFRGRILIDDTADDCFNIDVKKSTLTLSDDAWRAISDFSDQYKRKSRKAWEKAYSLLKQIDGKDPNSVSNDLASSYSPPDSLPGEPLPTPESERERKKREDELKEEMKSRLKSIVVRTKKEIEGVDVKETDITDEDIEEVLKQQNPSAHKIFRATFVEDNALWEPYYDAEKGGCVRINSTHRFARLLFEDNSSNTDLQIIFELLLLQMAEAEIYTQKALTDIKRELIEKIISEFRRNSSEYLATMCRKLDDKLPPFEK